MPLPVPVARQREVVCLPVKGHHVVLGTAGSGKTTMAILRAAYLADPELPGNGRTLLLTFNNALVGYIRAIAGSQLKNVNVENYHKFARGYLKFRGKMRHNAILSGQARLDTILATIGEARKTIGANPILQRPLGFFEAELRWLMDHGIQSATDYDAAERAGRAEARLERALRPVMWKIYEEYLIQRQRRGFDYDWNDLAAAVISELEVDKTARRYRHIVIDEGQDLSPQMLRSLAATVPEDGTISFFGDVAQQIYGHRMSWRSAGLKPLKVWNFSDNYRNSREIAALGLAISRMNYYRGAADMVAPTAPSAEGPLPTLVRFGTEASETRFLVGQATNLAKTQAVAILVRSVRQVDDLQRLLPAGTVNLRADTPSWRAGPRLFLGTYHSGKGLEFDAVMLPFLSQAAFPDPSTVEDFGHEEASAMDGRLLYVGVTRAKRALILTHTGNPSELLPPDNALYTKLNR